MVRGRQISNKTGTTQPDTLRAVLKAEEEFGPRELVVSGGAGAAETDEIFRIAGLMDILDEEGAIFFEHNREPFQSVQLEYEPRADVKGPQRSVMINSRVWNMRR